MAFRSHILADDQMESSTSLRVSSCGYKKGLSVSLKHDIEEYHSTTLASYADKVFIHNPYEFADENSVEKVLLPRREAFLTVSPSSVVGQKAVMQIPISERGCRFDTEGSSNLFKFYTYENCRVECRSNLTLKLCGCTNFFYPNSGRSRICNLNDVPCLAKNKYVLQNLSSEETIRMKSAEDTPCLCVPSCSITSYSVQMSNNKFVAGISMVNDDFYGEMLTNDSAVHVFFVDIVGERYRKSEYNNWHDLIGAIGGLLGLFLGFSLLTGIETVYYFTIRILLNKPKSEEPASDLTSSHFTGKHRLSDTSRFQSGMQTTHRIRITRARKISLMRSQPQF